MIMLAVVPNRWAWVKRRPLDVITVVVLPVGLQSLRVLQPLWLTQLSGEVFSLEGLR
jgi:hypothetical protein